MHVLTHQAVARDGIGKGGVVNADTKGPAHDARRARTSGRHLGGLAAPRQRARLESTGEKVQQAQLERADRRRRRLRREDRRRQPLRQRCIQDEPPAGDDTGSCGLLSSAQIKHRIYRQLGAIAPFYRKDGSLLGCA
jgi:hypothetical protein